MPFCTECGARHADDAKVCPNCGEPIFQSPSDDDLEEIVESLDDEVRMGEEMPEVEPEAAAAVGGQTPDYMEQVDQIRSQIAAQSSSLQSLTDLSWSNPAARQIKEQLAEALSRLRELRPPAAVAAGHADFLAGAELLADGFQRLVEASQQPNAESAVAAAEEAIAEATNRFLRGADVLNEYFMLEEAGLVQQLPVPPADVPVLQEEAGEELGETDLPEPPPMDDEEELPAAEPPALAAPAASHFGAPAQSWLAPPPMSSLAESDPGAAPRPGSWGTLGEAASDSMLLDIESGWVRARGQVYESIERAIRSAVSDAIRASLATRLRIEQEARATLDRIGAERNRLIDEVEALRREAHVLQAELADLRRSVNELERERQLAMDRRQQMFADAEAHRASLLREIEQLGGQLDSMRQNIVSLLNLSAGATTPLPTAGAVDAAAPARPTTAAAAAPAAGPAPAAPPAQPPAVDVQPAAARPGASTRQPPTPGTARPSAPPAEASVTEVRIAGVTSLGKNLQIQQAIKALPGVSVEGQPRYRGGVITATLRHAPDYDVAEALAELPDQPLSLSGSPAPGVLELTAT
ncbi:MAG TPA: zinc-ribbon domain-containing protein [Chloroflexota bacterium]|nr:zinc-ribbon domain-containing protein [Chloroflexota bacterium]